MVNYYSKPLKDLALDFYKTHTIKETLEIFKIRNGSLFNWIRLDKENKLYNKKKTYYRESKIIPNIKCYIRKYILQRISFNYKLLIRRIKINYKIDVSKSLLYSVIKKLNLTKKKIKVRTVVKNKRKHNKDIKKFKNKVKNINHNLLTSLDESSFDNELSAIYGWSEKGEEINKKVHINKKQRFTLICAINNKKIIHSKIIEKSTNKEVFKEFLNELLPKLPKNEYILLDNARIHHAKIVKKLIEDSGYEFIYNAPYCPEFNPIEKVFSKVKMLVRMKNNREPKILKRNILSALDKVKRKDLQNYYKKSLDF